MERKCPVWILWIKFYRYCEESDTEMLMLKQYPNYIAIIIITYVRQKFHALQLYYNLSEWAALGLFSTPNTPNIEHRMFLMNVVVVKLRNVWWWNGMHSLLNCVDESMYVRRTKRPFCSQLPCSLFQTEHQSGFRIVMDFENAAQQLTKMHNAWKGRRVPRSWLIVAYARYSLLRAMPYIWPMLPIFLFELNVLSVCSVPKGGDSIWSVSIGLYWYWLHVKLWTFDSSTATTQKMCPPNVINWNTTTRLYLNRSYLITLGTSDDDMEYTPAHGINSHSI